RRHGKPEPEQGRDSAGRKTTSRIARPPARRCAMPAGRKALPINSYATVWQMTIKALLAQVITQVRSAWRFRWYGVAAAWVLYLIGWVVVTLLPNVYEAQARVYVDTSSALRPVLNNQIIVPDLTMQLGYVRQELLGREHLERVMRDNNLDAEVRTPVERERLLEKLREDIAISSSSATNSVYTIAYQHAERDKAIGVVETLLNSLVEATLRTKQQG